ncbi:TetR family transcriptional regulator C-terminal domain-containing protein [Micromonospora sp. NBC_01655]|uniref:TetR family transcriptional regulator C-terminal domain-containing protein n=1 Tax=Micromonospora sp. NBC_01655 TaxID=2975983 RepID=UPI0022550E9E|nr:TetR family transcriptional regulator C-terminal domain-containing protein [Micromonospora sp. NBC_01655]MCX4471338.1 TetR family transcriptional regulator C-terminal domain-containing protein [Micromonospora sp. NBC_01655]
MLGHSSYALTAKTYTAVLPELALEAAEATARLVSRRGTKRPPGLTSGSLALDRYREQQAVQVDQALEGPGSVKERIAAAFELLIEMNFADSDRRGCLAVNTAAELAGFDEDATERVRAMFERTTHTFLDGIRVGQASGEISRDLDAEALANHLLTTLVGIQLLSKTSRDPELMKRSAQLALAPF